MVIHAFMWASTHVCLAWARPISETRGYIYIYIYIYRRHFALASAQGTVFFRLLFQQHLVLRIKTTEQLLCQRRICAARRQMLELLGQRACQGGGGVSLAYVSQGAGLVVVTTCKSRSRPPPQHNGCGGRSQDADSCPPAPHRAKLSMMPSPAAPPRCVWLSWDG